MIELCYFIPIALSRDQRDLTMERDFFPGICSNGFARLHSSASSAVVVVFHRFVLTKFNGLLIRILVTFCLIILPVVVKETGILLGAHCIQTPLEKQLIDVNTAAVSDVHFSL